MALTHEEVEHVARLAHLQLTAGELDQLTEQLSTILEHVSVLRTLDTSAVELESDDSPSTMLIREDEVAESWRPAAVLANAPRRKDDFFQVQAILD